MDNNKRRHTVEVEKVQDQDVYKITWKIPRFNKILRTQAMVRKCLANKNTVVAVPNTNFQLKISFLSRSKDMYLLDIYYLSQSSIYLEANLNMSLQNDYYDDFCQKYHAVPANIWQHMATAKPTSRSRMFGPEDDVRLDFRFTVWRDAKVDCGNTTKSQITDDFKNLLMDSSYSDVTMVSAEGVEFKVHKSIIAIRSKVLKAHFEHNTSESVTNVVKTTWETAVLRELFSFVYTDKAPHVDDNPEKLLAAADYYQLDGLKTLCEEAILKKLTVENAIDTLQLAEMHSAEFLRNSTLEFIKDGRARLITETQSWANIQSIEFLKRIYTFITADEIDNSDILESALDEIETEEKKVVTLWLLN